MTLPASGQISMSQVSTELSRSSTYSTSLGETAVRNLAGVPSGAIGFNNLHGKSAYTPFTMSTAYTGGDGYCVYDLMYQNECSTWTSYSATVYNGQGSFSYSWTKLSGDSQISISGNGASATVSSTAAWAVSGWFRCTITDNGSNAGGRQQYVDFQVSHTHEGM